MIYDPEDDAYVNGEVDAGGDSDHDAPDEYIDDCSDDLISQERKIDLNI